MVYNEQKTKSPPVIEVHCHFSILRHDLVLFIIYNPILWTADVHPFFIFIFFMNEKQDLYYTQPRFYLTCLVNDLRLTLSLCLFQHFRP